MGAALSRSSKLDFCTFQNHEKHESSWALSPFIRQTKWIASMSQPTGGLEDRFKSSCFVTKIMARWAKPNMASLEVQLGGFMSLCISHRTLVHIVCQYIFIVIRNMQCCGDACAPSISRQNFGISSILYRLGATIDIRELAEEEVCATGWDRRSMRAGFRNGESESVFSEGVPMGAWGNAPVLRKTLGRCPRHPAQEPEKRSRQICRLLRPGSESPGLQIYPTPTKPATILK